MERFSSSALTREYTVIPRTRTIDVDVVQLNEQGLALAMSERNKARSEADLARAEDEEQYLLGPLTRDELNEKWV